MTNAARPDKAINTFANKAVVSPPDLKITSEAYVTKVSIAIDLNIHKIDTAIGLLLLTIKTI